MVFLQIAKIAPTPRVHIRETAPHFFSESLISKQVKRPLFDLLIYSVDDVTIVAFCIAKIDDNVH